MVVSEATERSQIDDWDQVWCVYDIEAPQKPSAVSSIAKAADAGHLVAWSNPCFEIWLLLHINPAVPPFQTSAEVARELRRHLPDFKKSGIPSATLLANTEIAIKRSKLLNDRHDRDGNHPPADNPNTLVGVLVGELLAHA